MCFFLFYFLAFLFKFPPLSVLKTFFFAIHDIINLLFYTDILAESAAAPDQVARESPDKEYERPDGCRREAGPVPPRGSQAIYVSNYLSIYPSIHPYIYLSVSLYIYPCVFYLFHDKFISV